MLLHKSNDQQNLRVYSMQRKNYIIELKNIQTSYIILIFLFLWLPTYLVLKVNQFLSID